jgi:hypothetical protein
MLMYNYHVNAKIMINVFNHNSFLITLRMLMYCIYDNVNDKIMIHDVNNN